MAIKIDVLSNLVLQKHQQPSFPHLQCPVASSAFCFSELMISDSSYKKKHRLDYLYFQDLFHAPECIQILFVLQDMTELAHFWGQVMLPWKYKPYFFFQIKPSLYLGNCHFLSVRNNASVNGYVEKEWNSSQELQNVIWTNSRV